MDTRIKEFELASNCCGASDIYNGNLDNNEGVCADCGEHCEMEGEITMKLYELPRESKLVVPISDGKNHEATFHHIDGAYSLITLEDGTAVHLHANTNMKKVGDHYEIDEANQ